MRRAGAGRKALTETDPTLLADLQALVRDEERGDPESPLLWTAKGVRQLARALGEQGHSVHFASVAKLSRAWVRLAVQPQDQGGRVASGP